MVEGINQNAPKVSINPDVEAYLCCALIPENAKAVSATFQRDASIAPAQTIVFTPIDYRTSAVASPASAQETAVVDAAIVQNPRLQLKSILEATSEQETASRHKPCWMRGAAR